MIPCEKHRRLSADLETLIQQTTTPEELASFRGDIVKLAREMDTCADCKAQSTIEGGPGIRVGDVVQLNPEKHPKFAGCFAVVDELRSWGVIADIPMPGDPTSIVPVRLAWDAFAFVGTAPWVRERAAASRLPLCIPICSCGHGSSFDEFGNCSTCGGAVDPPVKGEG